MTAESGKPQGGQPSHPMTSRADFWEAYKRILDMATKAGIASVPIGDPRKGVDPQEYRRFIRACHRGYALAQRSLCEALAAVLEDTSLLPDEGEYRSLLLRKVADAMALALFGARGHIKRRVALHQYVQPVALQELRRNLAAAERLNSESRLTFALIADLTTFVHIADLVRIDFRKHPAEVSFHELKTGRVNTILLEQLKHYPVTSETVGNLANDSAIDARHRRQGQRILRQRLRLQRVEEVLTTDRGIDIVTERPIVLSEATLPEEYFDELLKKVIDESTQGVLAGVTLDRCLYITAFRGGPPEFRAKMCVHGAFAAALQARTNANAALQAILKEVEDLPLKDQLLGGDLVLLNLFGVPARPLTLWGLARDDLRKLVVGEVAVAICLDLCGLIALGRGLGLNLQVASTRATGQIRSSMGDHLVRIGDHGLSYGKGDKTVFMSRGLPARFLLDLTVPSNFLRYVIAADESEGIPEPRMAD